MKTLLLVTKDQLANLNKFYACITGQAEVNLRRLNAADQADLKTYFTQNIDTEDYDRIIFFLRFKHELRQVGFISADIGLGEYMTKNFKTMACDCLLITWNQGEEENKALGVVDIGNVVLYHSITELSDKLAVLRANTALPKSITREGQMLAEKQYNGKAITTRMLETIRPPLRDKPKLLAFNKYKYLFRR